MSEILDWRASFYEKYYDLRVLVPKGSSQDQVSSLALSTLGEFLRARREHVSLGGRYISTRQPTELSTSKRVRTSPNLKFSFFSLLKLILIP
jgi:hypothetical protein